LAHHLNQHAFGLGSDSGMRSKGNVLASHFRPRFVALKSRKKMKARLARDRLWRKVNLSVAQLSRIGLFREKL
jgi:hypothetical protein